MDKTSPYDLHSALGYRLTLAARTNQQLFDGLLSEINITRQMWCVLVAVGAQGITLPTEIAKYIGINRTSASRSLRQMEKIGLLDRAGGKQDKRTTHIMLTVKGRKTLDKSMLMSATVRSALRARLTNAEQAQLFELLGKLLQGDAIQIARI